MQNACKTEITQEKFLSDDERAALTATLSVHKGERDALMLRVLMETGARGCEIVGTSTVEGVTLGSLKVEKRAVFIRGAKNSRNRTVPVSAELYADLIEYATAQGLTDDSRLFPMTTRRLRQIWDIYRPNQKKGLHSTRHTFGTLLYINCENIRKVQGLLGHKNLNNTNIYVDYVEQARGARAATRGMWKQKIAG